MPFHSVFRFNVGDSLAEIKVTGQRCLGVHDNIAIVGQKYHHVGAEKSTVVIAE